MAQILLVGVAALDIINTVDGYPPEDAEVRSQARRIARGGNAANSAVVLGGLGHACSLAAVLGTAAEAAPVYQDLHQRGIDLGAARILDGCGVPTSYITVNRRTGSRTIIHYRDVPEYGYEDFAAVGLEAFEWVHFEGRNVPDTTRMLARVRRERPHAMVSLEIEKPRLGGEEGLFDLADLLLLSKSYALARGHRDAEALLAAARARAPEAALVCSWGSDGAWAQDCDGQPLYNPAYPPSRVVETIGAGDTFNAGLIHGVLVGQDLAEALRTACRLAGRKCGQSGFDDLTTDLGPDPRPRTRP